VNHYIPWSWADSLGGLRPDPERAFRVEQILFGLVRDRCREMGLAEGEEVRCTDRNPDEVSLEFSNGEVRRLELPYAWFVQVEPVALADGPGAT
jgi:hypothetical protein